MALGRCSFCWWVCWGMSFIVVRGAGMTDWKSQYLELDHDFDPRGSKKLKQIKRLTSSPCYALHTKNSIKSSKNTSISTPTDQGLASKTFILSTSYWKERTNSLKSTTVISKSYQSHNTSLKQQHYNTSLK